MSCRLPVFSSLLLALLLAACTAPQTRSLRSALPAAAAPVAVPGLVEWPPSPPQNAATALATVLAASGLARSPAELQAGLPAVDSAAAASQAMATAVRQQGRLLYPLAPHLGALLAALEQGYPVLVLQNRRLLGADWQYAVVVGADRAAEEFRLRTVESSHQAMSFATFERHWARADYWGVLVLDPARIPDSLEARMVIHELAVLEAMGQTRAAQAGFARALLNWPEQKTAWLGLASTSRRLGENEQAESVLRELVRREPHYGAGLNNLADLLLKSGRAQEALPYAERAVSYLDVPQSRATLAAVRAALLAPAPAVSIPLRRPAAPPP